MNLFMDEICPSVTGNGGTIFMDEICPSVTGNGGTIIPKQAFVLS